MASPFNQDEFGDPKWRLSNLYYITDVSGRRVRFQPNDVQLAFLDSLWYLNVVLKSRQHGFSTLIDLILLDQAVFTPLMQCGIIAHGLAEAQEIFRTKVKFPYENLPEGLRQHVAPTTDSKSELILSNGSRVAVGTSMRSGTYQYLHVSEYGKIARRYPDRAKEIVTGSFNAVHPGQFVFVESTAEGRDGYFYSLCQTARKLLLAKAKLTPLDFAFHFYAWWQDKRNRIDPAGVVVTDQWRRYFEKLAELGIDTDAAQQAWYIKRAEINDEGMKAEHPSTPDEAFEASVAGAIYGKQMEFLRTRGRITRVDFQPGMPVNTFWDLGRSDCNSIWFHQFVAGEHRFVRFFQDRFQDLAYYVRQLQRFAGEHGYIYGYHYLPHDAENENLERNESRVDRLVELGVPMEKIMVVPRTDSLNADIEQVRKALPLCWFDAAGTDEGVACLDNYTWRWNDTQGVWLNDPLHNDFSHGADAFRTFVMGWGQAIGARPGRRRRGSAMTA